MPRKKKGEYPSLRRHKGRNLGVVTLSNEDIYLGTWSPDQENPPAEVQAAYDVAIAEWLQRGRKPRPPSAGGPTPAPPDSLPPQALSVAELVARWWKWAEGYYVGADGEPTGELHACRSALRPLVFLLGQEAAAAVGPLKLKAVRRLMVEGYRHPVYGEQPDLSRALINARVRRCVRVWRWAVGEELVPVEVYQALKAVPGLPKGRGAAKEREPVKPAVEADVTATLPHLPPSPRAMVRLQLLTGMRPGELCRLKLTDLDRSGDVWLYRPHQHKTRHRGKARVVAVGPKSQAVINEYIAGRDVAEDKPLFSPARDREERFAAKRAARKTPVQPSQTNRRKTKPKKVPGERYTTGSYCHAVANACKKAGVPLWSPNQLRHSHATAVRAALGLEAAQAALGHARADITQLYAERDLSLAVRVARELG